MGDRRDGTECLAPKPECPDAVQVFARCELARGVRGKSERKFVVRYSVPIVDDFQSFSSATFDADDDASRPGVNGVLNEFFRNACRTLDHLTRGDLIHERR